MNLLRVFGIGSQAILAKNHSVSAQVTQVRPSALHTVKKPVRLYTAPDNTLYSHFVTFRYHVDGIDYMGTLFVDLRFRCPQKGEQIELYYDPEKPKNYACYAFAPSAGQIGW